MSEFDIYKLDSMYKSFPSFTEWEKLEVDLDRWEQYLAELVHQKKKHPNYTDVLESIKNAAAIDTGEIEDLYKLERGFTVNVAQGAITLEAAFIAMKDQAQFKPAVEAQIKLMDYVLDLATKRTPITEHIVRSLHEVVTQNQKSFRALTEQGKYINMELKHGQYKQTSNHVIQANGIPHAYAPVDEVPIEMNKLMTEIRSVNFEQANPILQASYIHYAFVCIHPFSDGNGRVARALASIFTMREASIPLLILIDTKMQYLDALNKADDGEYGEFVRFIQERSFDTIRLFSSLIKESFSPDMNESRDIIKQARYSRGGYDEKQIEGFARSFVGEIEYQYRNAATEISDENQKLYVNLTQNIRRNHNPSGYRWLDSYLVQLHLQLSAKAFNSDHQKINHILELRVPENPNSSDDLTLFDDNWEPIHSARISELEQGVSVMLKARINAEVDTLIREMLDRLAKSINS